MVDERLTDGVRIAQLLASEIAGNEGRLRDLAVDDADPDVEPTVDGALAYRVVRDAGAVEDASAVEDADADPIAEVYVQPERVRVEFASAPDAVADAAVDGGLRVRPKAVRPPRTLVFVEDGAQVKRLLPVLGAALDAAVDGGR
ncbi:hypothetical protein GJ633_16035 [Halorubrum sp. CBA1125]|uniref:hypothetical protein n=1 Tax=Halorubrum sp. CBA1125 TaxID=2668072 RepID=UPI0012E8E445|nr:hypothetical protein [Halorubrum sp. CBA1125]MUW15935.1 hypothetical protein [Halorubrum sp. CBA1125]